ncbi:hypothetical protein DdX_19778 [Ditylenchus destructor]|uniref:Uncharacterized protein n=1 Tax=Ditylenchus destructor TaxID=166010 RepID=A0AAD4QS58_9BILA|nr:hypothetical protein DdX_19778 [Ditylenchus destructor]
MPIPESYVRFQQVNIWRLLGKSTLQFLCDAKESFVGSAIHYPMKDIVEDHIIDQHFSHIHRPQNSPNTRLIISPTTNTPNHRFNTHTFLNRTRFSDKSPHNAHAPCPSSKE